MDELLEQIYAIGKKAKAAAAIISNADANTKNIALTAIAENIIKNKDNILKANQKDLDLTKEKGLNAALLDRLKLNQTRIEAMANGIKDIVKLEDPVRKVIKSWKRPNDLKISRISVALGVIGIIYESRPNVTADAGALCIKSGNAAILRGGSESFYSSNAIIECVHAGLKEAGLPQDIIQAVPTTDRNAVSIMLKMNDYIDVIIPRGGKGLCKKVQDESRIPTLLHLDGNCHTYVHEKADLDMALSVIKNAKLRRTGICGATESLVIDSSIANKFIPKIVDTLAGCEIVGDQIAVNIDDRIKPASDEDYYTEYLDSKISIKTVASLKEAIYFINKHSSHHTDAIITDDSNAAKKFLKLIDSAIVMHNTSTQFADGGEFGMGAEIGISTGRLHARGPVGVEQLTTYKYLVEGNGQTRA